MRVRIQEGDIHLIDLRTRMPFRYGIATMTRTPHAFVRLRVEVEGKTTTGIAADHLPPRWFQKDPARSIPDEVGDMLRVIENAVRTAAGLEGPSPFDVWRRLYRAQGEWGASSGFPPLLTHFGTSLVERALIEAVSRAAGRPFALLLRENGLGIWLGEIHPSLAGVAPRDLLPREPLESITVRHTVGLSDPLRDSDILPADRLDDGLPQSLESSVRVYGLRHFKVKVSGDLLRDFERLLHVKEVVEAGVTREYAFSLDGNEQFASFGDFRKYWQGLIGIHLLQPFLRRLLFVEQPLHRQAALAPSLAGEIEEWPGRPPLIIDESDGDLESLPRALELGYRGTSHKNCKGIFKGIANACLLARIARDEPARRPILSGEDLANIGPVALLQDLAVCAALGIQSVERNGHHYFAGLSQFPKRVQEQVLEAHGDLYNGRSGWPALTIDQGTIQLDSVLAAPFGVGFDLEAGQFTPLEAFRKSYFEKP